MNLINNKETRSDKKKWAEYMSAYNRENYALETSILYCVRSKAHDNRVVYIGSTLYTLSNRRTRHQHDALKRNSNGLFHQAIRKLGMDNFSFELVDENNKTLTERFLIDLIRPEFNVLRGDAERKVRN